MPNPPVTPADTAGGWRGIERLPYSAADTAALPAITRQLLAGGPGSGCAYEVRYFELAAGGRSRRERHQHQHAVVVMRGRGELWLEGEAHPLAPGDLVRVGPGQAHQFSNAAEEPFGFLCIVDSERDRPVPLAGEAAEGGSCDLPAAPAPPTSSSSSAP